MYFSKIGWRIDIPAGYKISDTLSPKNFLFSIVDDRVNFLGAYLIPFDSKRDGDWPVFVRSSNKKEYDMGKYEGVQSDSVSGEETISGNRFEKFITIRRLNGKVISSSAMLNKQFGRYCLRISLIYRNKESEEQLLTILRGSSFTKPE